MHHTCEQGSRKCLNIDEYQSDNWMESSFHVSDLLDLSHNSYINIMNKNVSCSTAGEDQDRGMGTNNQLVI